MRVLYERFGSRVRPNNVGCAAIGSAVYFNSRYALYSAGSGVNKVQVVLSGLMCMLLCFVKAKTCCMYVLVALMPVCRCDGDVIIIGHDLYWYPRLWYVCSVNVKQCGR